MNDILSKILQTKAIELQEAKSKITFNEIRNLAQDQPPPRDFLGAIQVKHEAGLAAVIAEIKKASPSKGLIRSDFQPDVLALAYEEGGAACMSVLTDEFYFQGHSVFLQQARKAASIPALRKDFIIDAYQIYQSRAWGADAILLIATALERNQLMEFEDIAHELGMTVLLELHEECEINKCLDMKTPLWGVNNRNLRTFKVDIHQTLQLLPSLKEKIVVTESGILTPEDIQFMQQHGVNTFLIGESLMRSPNITKTLNQLVHAGKKAIL